MCKHYILEFYDMVENHSVKDISFTPHSSVFQLTPFFIISPDYCRGTLTPYFKENNCLLIWRPSVAILTSKKCLEREYPGLCSTAPTTEILVKKQEGRLAEIGCTQLLQDLLYQNLVQYRRGLKDELCITKQGESVGIVLQQQKLALIPIFNKFFYILISFLNKRRTDR